MTKKKHTLISIGDRIKKYRNRKKMSQSIAAEKIGIPVSALCRIETGKANTSMKTLIKIEDALDIQLFI